MAGKFEGFSDETRDFLWGVKFNNEREWFLEHKPEYERYVSAPMQSLTREVWEIMERRFSLGTEPHCSRIYRDARRLHGHGPYKENMWLTLRRHCDDWTETPVFYFEIRPEVCEYGMGCYRMAPHSMESFRKSVLDDPSELTGLIEQFNSQSVFQLSGDEYKRKKGKISPLIDPWFNKKEMNFSRKVDWGREIKAKNLPQKLAEHFALLIPLYKYLLGFALDKE